MIVRQTTFDEAIKDTSGLRRLLLLGNGFSRDFDDQRFAYRSLYERAPEFSPPVAAIFETRKPDFEAVLDFIADQQRVASGSDLAELNRQEAEVKRAFVDVISRAHPASSNSISVDQVASCVRFLKHFVDHKTADSRRGKVFTTNYDLLLLWVIAKAQRRQIKCHDGFKTDDHPNFGLWQQDNVASLIYLHGALHIHQHEGQHRMLRYREGARLVDQIRDRLDAREFPLIVAEGTSERKTLRIGRSRYLEAAGAAFKTTLTDDKTALFIFGHSMSGRDGHILSEVGKRRVRAVYVSAYGGLRSDDGRRAAKWAEVWSERRAQGGNRWPIDVAVYDSKSCPIWRPKTEPDYRLL